MENEVLIEVMNELGEAWEKLSLNESKKAGLDIQIS